MLEDLRRYIFRHWHGRLTLARSFWVNWLLVGVAVQCVDYVTARAVPWTGSLFLVVMWAILRWVGIGVTMLWGTVGIWRSSVRENRATGRWVGPLAASITAIAVTGLFVFTIVDAWRDIGSVWHASTIPPDIGAHHLTLLAGGTAVEYSGGFDGGATEDLRYFLDTHPLVGTIYLDSPGGVADEGHGLRDLIHARGLSTAVSKTCASACAIAFVGGSKRMVSAGGKIGFHRPWATSPLHGDIGKEIETTKREMLEAGVEAWFVDKAFSTPFTSMWWPTPIELRQAHVVAD